jgi:hypothetical protein
MIEISKGLEEIKYSKQLEQFINKYIKFQNSNYS